MEKIKLTREHILAQVLDIETRELLVEAIRNIVVTDGSSLRYLLKQTPVEAKEISLAYFVIYNIIREIYPHKPSEESTRLLESLESNEIESVASKMRYRNPNTGYMSVFVDKGQGKQVMLGVLEVLQSRMPLWNRYFLYISKNEKNIRRDGGMSKIGEASEIPTYQSWFEANKNREI